MRAHTTTQRGPLSSTDWVVTSTPTFPELLSHNDHDNSAVFSYHSPQTSLRGLAVLTDEPLCTLHIVLATESNGGTSTVGSVCPSWHHPDDGLPHTLEHLVFLGSLTHPHKGVLDKLANRCMANGTNAWTATDHTAYTLTTAGPEGVVRLLPIFAGHVLFPTLTAEGFVTEVHHVNGSGENKGVVYCEMQGRENTEATLVDHAILKLLYPGACGYSAETGGKLANLRGLTVDKVRRYHQEYYTPDNTLLVLTGNIDHHAFFQALDQVEALVLKRANPQRDTIIRQRIGTRQGRPWVHSKVPQIQNTLGIYPPANYNTNSDSHPTAQPLVVSFPSEDESRGTISLAWRGPLYSSRSEWTHLSLLWDYLTDSAASPLQRAFVENQNPLCADVTPAHDVFTEGYHQLWFQECDVHRMDQVLPLFYDTILKQAGLKLDPNETFDEMRMRSVIRRYRRQLMESAERRPTSAIIQGIVRNFLYGPRAGDGHAQEKEIVDPLQEMEALHADINILPLLAEAESKWNDISYWQGLLTMYILDRPMAVVLGKPSAAMATEISTREKEREVQQAKDLGDSGLKDLAETLEKAMISNEQPIPDDILTSLPVPDLKKVPSIPLFTVRLAPSTQELTLSIIPQSIRDITMEEAQLIIDKLRNDAGAHDPPLVAVPFHADLTHIESAFVFAAVGIDTTPLTTDQRLYLPILEEILFKLPVTLENGKQLTKQEFVNQLHDETVSYSAGVGLLGGSIPQMSYISVQVENIDGSGLSTALAWIRRVLYLTHITGDAVKTAIQRLISEIPPQVRYGPSIVAAVSSELNFCPEKSNTVACNVLRQKPFLAKIFEKIGSKLDGDRDEEEEEEEASENNSGLEDIVNELQSIREALFQTTNIHAFVAANLKCVPNALKTIVSSLTNGKMESVAQGRLIQGVSASSVLRSNDESSSLGGEGAVCALSAIESGFLTIVSEGVKPYDPNRAALLVAIEYLTALEGDFWVKLRGAGLTYSYSINDSTDSLLLKFSLFKCTDIPAAFEKALSIITDYASGNAEISLIGLENAKASLAYQIISTRSSKLGAATSSFVSTFKDEKMDYDRHLLSEISAIKGTDVIHSVVTYLVKVFDPMSKLIIACPPNKLEAIHDFFVNRGWTKLKKVPEEKLFTSFVESNSDNTNDIALPEKVPGMSMFLPGAFASQFRCSCPRCDF